MNTEIAAKAIAQITSMTKLNLADLMVSLSLTAP
jgi:hypothetical protein